MASVALHTDNKGRILSLSRSAVCNLLTHPLKGKIFFLLFPAVESLVFVSENVYTYSMPFSFKCT